MRLYILGLGSKLTQRQRNSCLDRHFSKFINVLMYAGKKSTAERMFYEAMDIVEAKTSQPGVTIFKQALSNLKAVVEMKSRRVGGATYQVPSRCGPSAVPPWRCGG